MNRQARPANASTAHVLSPLRDFLRTEAAGGMLLAAGAIIALVWANSPWSASYHDLWSTTLSIRLGRFELSLVLRQWLNEGLITIFFFVVGLEIKRELASGQLASRRAAMLPVAAAIGGMAVPALLYLAIAGQHAARGWAIVIATDIPLALGVLAIADRRVPSSLRVFLLALAIVDDIGALLIIAVLYSKGVGWGWLAGAIVAVIVSLAGRRAGLQRQWIYVILGCLLWLCLHEAGVNATLAGVAMGLLAPTTPRIPAEFVDIEELADVGTAAAARTTTDIARGSVSVVEWLEHLLHPWTSYVIVPVFAVANTGITLTGDLFARCLPVPDHLGHHRRACARQADRHRAGHWPDDPSPGGRSHRRRNTKHVGRCRHIRRHGVHRRLVHHGTGVHGSNAAQQRHDRDPGRRCRSRRRLAERVDDPGPTGHRGALGPQPTGLGGTSPEQLAHLVAVGHVRDGVEGQDGHQPPPPAAHWSDPMQ